MSETLITIKGKAQWTDSAGNEHPIRNAQIQLWEDDVFDDDSLANSFTKDDGTYELKVSLSKLLSDGLWGLGGKTELFIIIKPQNNPSESQGNSFTVKDANSLNLSVFQAGFDFVLANDFLSNPSLYGNTAILNLQTPQNSLKNQAFSIFDAINVGYQYHELVSPSIGALPRLDVRFPSREGSAYVGEPQYYIKGAEPDWKDWDVILHEFGHYLAAIDKLGFSLGELSHQRGISGIGRIDTKTGKVMSKEEGSLMAWNEGLADYLSLAIQHVAASEGFLPKDLPNVSDKNGKPDTFVTAKQHDIDINLENKLDPKQSKRFSFVSNPKGEGDEASVSRILWDLADGKNEPHDQIEVVFNSGVGTVGHVALYRILDTQIPEGSLDKLDDIWNFFVKEENKDNLDYLGLPSQLTDNAKREKLGKIFEEYGVSPSVEKIEEDKLSLLGLIEESLGIKKWNPSITWQLGNNNANDTFEIIVFNEDFSQKVIEKSVNGEWTPDSTGTKGEWKPKLDIKYGMWTWRELYKNPGDYHLVITGRDTDEFTTDSYWSGAKSFTIEPYDQDNDTDGILDAIEQLAGDRNQDGTPDSQQANVASFPKLGAISNNPNDFITLASPNKTTLSNVSVTDTLPLNAPQDTNFPLGLLNFNLENITNGSANKVNLLLPEGVTANTYWKYDTNQGWYEFLYDGTTGAEFQDKDGDGENELVILHLSDGQRGDIDATADSIITHMGIPGLTKNPPINSEKIKAPFSGGPSAVKTTNSYSGLVEIDITGTGQAAGASFSDSFYRFSDSTGSEITPVLANEFGLYINGEPAEVLFPQSQSLPTYSSDHSYSFMIDAPGGALTFGVGDTYTIDNTGFYDIAIEII
ncbi:choice-of-anchor U domain-containing protein [Calothrix sp. CCY 0018]|uniref:choice-of-anchor U domain-containing protein n=1 Tax=Calothrix sp. CCY 0018 TaxID=3103864 RepID=UPI0039C6C05B